MGNTNGGKVFGKCVDFECKLITLEGNFGNMNQNLKNMYNI